MQLKDILLVTTFFFLLLLITAIGLAFACKTSTCWLRTGPVLLEDYHLIEKLAQFDRERIPERVVHARGATAKGFFEVSTGLLQYVVSLLVHVQAHIC